MDPTATFEELRFFWESAYSSLTPDPRSDLQTTLKRWASDVLAVDGIPLTSPFRDHFSLKPMEPFFGSWRSVRGGLSLAGKTVVTLINPGDGIDFQHCASPNISLVGRPYWALLKEFYTTGAVLHNGASHTLLYKRDLMNPSYNYRNGTRKFGWGWWTVQWANMLHAIGETRDEEDCFLTLELFAYSSLTAGRLSTDVLSALTSSRLVVRLLAELICQSSGSAPRCVVLVNKLSVWQSVLKDYRIEFEALSPCNRAGEPIAFRGRLRGRPTPTPLILLNRAQGMKFPRGPEVTRLIFETREGTVEPDA